MNVSFLDLTMLTVCLLLCTAFIVTGCSDTASNPSELNQRSEEIPAADGPDLFGAQWGMNVSEFLESKTEELIKAENVEDTYENDFGQRFLIYGPLDTHGFEADVYFRFIHGVLIGASYSIKTPFRDTPEKYFAIFEDLKSTMTDQLGEPETVEYEWEDESLKEHPDLYPIAIKQGALTVRTTWETPRTIINLSTSQNPERDNQPNHVINFLSREPKHIALVEAYKNAVK